MLKFHYQSSFYCTYVHIARNMSSFIQWTEFFYIQCTHFMSLYFTLSEWLTRLLYFVWVGVWRWNLMKTKSMVHGKYNSNMWLLRNIVFASLSSNNAFFLCFVDKHILIRDISVSDISQWWYVHNKSRRLLFVYSYCILVNETTLWMIW